MPTEQVNLTIGTAGHIDHGKTALVKCLTGCDTDRLKAEKERGMSIDLGFAPCTIADTEVGIVDVPGHENFIKTMVAGAAGMDAVLLVVAADDGVMPQTREHLDILTLLGVQHGLVVLTKIDRVDPETLELAAEDVYQYVQGTFLEGTPLLPVSSVTGEGFDGFLEALATLMQNVKPKPVDGLFRLPLDRSFTVKGYGTVVSGIPVCGSARIDEEVVLLPQGETGRLRGIEVYGRNSDTVLAGQCAALNVRHFDHRNIRRGNTLTVPGYFTPEQWYVATLRLLGHENATLKHGANVKLHTGTAEVNATVYAMQGDRMRPGEEHLVQLRTETPVVAGPGDRYIVRSTSPVRTVGGGAIIESIARKLKRNRENTYEDLVQRAQAMHDQHRFVEYCVSTARALATTAADIAVRTKLPRGRVERILNELAEGNHLLALSPKLYMHRDVSVDAKVCVLDLVRQYHRESPESPGITLEKLRDESPLDRAVLDGLVELLRTEQLLVDREDRLSAADHQPRFDDQDRKQLEAIEERFRSQLFHPPGLSEIVALTGVSADEASRLIGILREHKKLVRVAEGMFFHRDAIQRGREILLEHFSKEPRLESVRFKYLLDTTRKFALPLLDHFDRIGVTRRDGNTRYLKRPPDK